MQAVAPPLAAQICTIGGPPADTRMAVGRARCLPKARRRTVATHYVRRLPKEGLAPRVYNTGTFRMGVHQVLNRWGMCYFSFGCALGLD